MNNDRENQYRAAIRCLVFAQQHDYHKEEFSQYVINTSKILEQEGYTEKQLVEIFDSERDKYSQEHLYLIIHPLSYPPSKRWAYEAITGKDLHKIKEIAWHYNGSLKPNDGLIEKLKKSRDEFFGTNNIVKPDHVYNYDDLTIMFLEENNN